MIKQANHPLAPPSGQIHLHRIVLYDAIGEGPHACHACGQSVDWRVSGKTSRGCLVVDHLDGDPTNNALENLAPSCHSCNTRRGHDSRMNSTLFLVTEKGHRKEAVQRTCALCGRLFLAAKTAMESRGKTKKGEYCSRKCQNTMQARVKAEKDRALSAAAVPRILEMRAQGESYDGIAIRLGREGLIPPRGDRWAKATIYKIVQRERHP